MSDTTSTMAASIGLAGQPNTGKSTLFNRLTGSRQHVGNWPGKTIEKKTGTLVHNGSTYTLIDLPGTYSLSANSAEELISRDHIVSESTDALIVMLDASQLQRSMYLLSETVGINIPVMVACTMMDVAEKQGKVVDIAKLEAALGVPVVAINAARGDGIESLKKQMGALKQKGAPLPDQSLRAAYRNIYGERLDELAALLPEKGIGRYGREWLCARLVESDKQISGLVQQSVSGEIWNDIRSVLAEFKDGALKIANARYDWISTTLDGAVGAAPDRVSSVQSRFDRIATHWFFGKLVSVLMIVVAFVVAFLVVMPFLIGFSLLMPLLIGLVDTASASLELPVMLVSFFKDGVISFLYVSVLMISFITAVVFVFGLMEDIGLFARIAFVHNSLMEALGLNGKSILPFISGFGCNIASVAGCRVIDCEQQRKVTIATSLAIPCPGIWGIVALLTGIFFQGAAPLIAGALFVVSLLHIMVTAWFFRDKCVRKEHKPGLIMELPPFHMPNWKTIFQYVWGKAKAVTVKAGGAILITILGVWALTYTESGDITKSALYGLGKFLEPVTRLVGFDWRLALSFLIAAFSKEATLGAIAIFFGLSELGTSLGSSIYSPITYDAAALSTTIGSTVSKASALAFIFAFYFNIPCFGTIAAIRSETGSTGYTLKLAAYYVVTALLIAGVVYRIGLLVF